MTKAKWRKAEMIEGECGMAFFWRERALEGFMLIILSEWGADPEKYVVKRLVAAEEMALKWAEEGILPDAEDPNLIYA